MTAATMQTHWEVQQFLYNEAATLDERRFRDWLDFFTEDTHYWMPIRRTRTADQLDLEFTGPEDMSFFDDDKALLDMRVRKLETGYSWSEDPPSRTRHIVSNVRIVADDGNELQVECDFILYRTRLNSEEDMWVGMRKDTLRRDGDSYKIAKRVILLDQTLVLSKNLSNFF
jgi:3-phenylpropionate/cinnamic acid dioxygenase small subunit